MIFLATISQRGSFLFRESAASKTPVNFCLGEHGLRTSTSSTVHYLFPLPFLSSPPPLSFFPSLLSSFSPLTRRFLIEIIIYRGYFLFRHPASRRETLARSILLAHFLSYSPFLGKRSMRAYDNHLRDGVRTMTILSFISFGNFLSRNANSASFEWTISS